MYHEVIELKRTHKWFKINCINIGPLYLTKPYTYKQNETRQKIRGKKASKT